MMLVDTSVWIDHLQRRSNTLSAALDRESVLTHPLIIGELACGSIKHRREVLSLLSDLPSAVVATHDEVLLFIEQQHLMGKGIGFIDAHLLASTALTPGSRLWTRDKRLAALALTLFGDVM